MDKVMTNVSSLSTPVLLVTFNRPLTTKRVFESIKKAKPDKFYFFNDAPRDGNSQDSIARMQIIEMISEIDWECKYYSNFPEINLGCGKGVSTAISWAFENEDRLIILEDDCVPSQPFFSFCDFILEKFKNDTRIWTVSGRSENYPIEAFMEYDYIFSQFGQNSGWGTWKRCWDKFDITMNDLQNFITHKGFYNYFLDTRIAKLYTEIYKKQIYSNTLLTHAWDFQFGFTVISNRGLTVIPAKNLVENIGYYGTHSFQKTHSHEINAETDFEIVKEPKYILPSRKIDAWHFQKHKLPQFKTRLMKKIVRKLHKIIITIKRAMSQRGSKHLR